MGVHSSRGDAGTQGRGASSCPKDMAELVALIVDAGAAFGVLLRTLIRDELAQRAPSASSGPDQPRPTVPRMREDLLSTTAAASHAGVTPGTIRSWVKSGKLRGYRAGRLLRIRLGDLEDLLASGRAGNVVDLDAEARRILAGARRR